MYYFRLFLLPTMRAVMHTPSQQLVRSTPGHVVRSTNMPSHMVTSTPSPNQHGSTNHQQLVRSTPGHVARSTDMPSHLVNSIPSQQGVRSNMTPSQDMMNMISSKHLPRSLSRPSSSSQLPRRVSVKNNRDGTIAPPTPPLPRQAPAYPPPCCV